MPLKKTQKIRLDILLMERALVKDQKTAEGMIMAGEVIVGGKIVSKAGHPVAIDADITIKSRSRFVSRAGDKLQAAIDRFCPPVAGAVCADIGASTGGFTDCLLQNGATLVYAVDVGHGLLDIKLQQDPRVRVMDGVNARAWDGFPRQPQIVTIDCSFISLKSILPQVAKWMSQGGTVIALIKPQFEATHAQAARGRGVIEDPKLRRQILEDVLSFARQAGFEVAGEMESPVRGKKSGNVEYLACLSYHPSTN